MVLPNHRRSSCLCTDPVSTATASSPRLLSHRGPKQKHGKRSEPQSDERKRPDPPECLAPSCTKLESLPEKYSDLLNQGLSRRRPPPRRQEPTGTLRDEPRSNKKQYKEQRRRLARQNRTHKKEASQTADRQRRVEKLDNFDQQFLRSHPTKSSSFVENPMQKMLQVYTDLRQRQFNVDDESLRVRSDNVSSLSGSSLGGDSSGRKSLLINPSQSNDAEDKGVRGGSFETPAPRDRSNSFREARPCYIRGTPMTAASSSSEPSTQSADINARQLATGDTDVRPATERGEHLGGSRSAAAAVERGGKPRFSSLNDRPSEKHLKYLYLEVGSNRSFAKRKSRLQQRGGVLLVQNRQKKDATIS